MKRSALTIFIACTCLLSCTKDHATDCFKGNGTDLTQVRHPGTFSQVNVNDKFEVYIHQAQECRVELTGGAKVLKGVGTEVSDGVLSLSNNNKCNFVRGYKREVRADIYLPYLQYLQNDNVGVVWFDAGFRQDSISIKGASSGDIHLDGEYRVVKTSSNSNGDVYLSGKTKKLFVFTTGVNYVWGSELSVSDYMFVHTVTMGDCYVNAQGTGQFDYNIQKSGNIYYRGEPSRINNFSEPGSTGKLIKQDQ